MPLPGSWNREMARVGMIRAVEATAEAPGRDSWLDPRLVIGMSPIEGRGLLAAETIAAGEAVERVGGILVSDEGLRCMISQAPSYVDSVSVYDEVNLVLPPDRQGSAAQGAGADPAAPGHVLALFRAPGAPQVVAVRAARVAEPEVAVAQDDAEHALHVLQPDRAARVAQG